MVWLTLINYNIISTYIVAHNRKGSKERNTDPGLWFWPWYDKLSDIPFVCSINLDNRLIRYIIPSNSEDVISKCHYTFHFTSLHFDGSLEGAQLQRLNPFFPRPFPAECYPVKIISPSWRRRCPTPTRAHDVVTFVPLLCVGLNYQRCIGTFDLCDQQGWPTLAPFPYAKTMPKSYQPLCRTLEQTDTVSLSAANLAVILR